MLARITDAVKGGSLPKHTLEADGVARELISDLRVTLAVLVGADDDVVELTLGLLPFGSRSALVAYGAIAPVSPHDKPNDEPVQVRLVPFGRYLINACALRLTDAERADIDVRLREYREARARREAEDGG